MNNTTLPDTETELMAWGKAFFLSFLAIAAYMMTGFDAFASGAGITAEIGVVKSEAEAIVPMLGTIAIIVLGITAMFGRITWNQALVVAIGIALASGAPTIYADLQEDN